MNATLMRALCAGVYHSGLLGAAMGLTEPLRGNRTDGRFQILVYHRVGERIDAFAPGTPVAVFERHMRYVRQQFRVLSLTELLAATDRGAVPPRAVAVTFDDGYADTHEFAAPILQRYRIPATVYLATGLLETDRPMWNDRVGVAIRDTTSARLDGVPECGGLPLTTPEERRTALTRTLQALKPLPPAERDARADQLSQVLHVPLDRGPRMLCWRQVEEMRAGGVEFGAHTVHHPVLTAVSIEERRREIVDSKRVIEDRLQAPVRHFAYPFGRATDFDATTKRLVREAGFVSAVSMVFGTNTAATDRYALLRGGPWEETTALFAAKLWWYRRAGLGAVPSTEHAACVA